MILFVYHVKDIHVRWLRIVTAPFAQDIIHDCPVFDFPYLVGVCIGRPRDDIASPPPRILLVPNTRLRRP